MSLDPNIVKLLLEQIAESKKELNEAYKRKQDLIQLHDQLRDTVYANWDEEMFDKTNRDTWPPELRDSDVVLDLLDNLNEGVGYCHMLVIKHRYPDLHPVPHHLSRARRRCPCHPPIRVSPATRLSSSRVSHPSSRTSPGASGLGGMTGASRG